MRKLGPVILVIAVYAHMLAVDKVAASGSSTGNQRVIDSLLSGRFNWMVSPPLLATKDKPFAGPINARHEGMRWTDSFSHGELIRDSHDEKLVVDPDKLRLLFQGVTDRAKRGKKYGEIPWRLGMLRPAR